MSKYQKIDDNGKKSLLSILGRKNITKEDVNRIRKIILSTEALDCIREMASRFAINGKEILKDITFHSKEAEDYFKSLAEFAIHREY